LEAASRFYICDPSSDASLSIVALEQPDLLRGDLPVEDIQVGLVVE